MQSGDPAQDGELRARVSRKLRSLEYVLLTTSDGRGQLRGRPLALHRAGFDGELWLALGNETDVMEEVSYDPRVNVSCMDVTDGFYLCISGIARPSAVRGDKSSDPPAADGDAVARRYLRIEVNRAHMWAASEPFPVSRGLGAPGSAIEIRL